MNQDKWFSFCKLYQGRPVDYAYEVLGVQLTPQQEQILNLLVVPPYRVLVRSSNQVGKSFVAGIAALYGYDCFDPSITIVSAPIFSQVQDITFKEIRNLGKGREGFQPVAPVLKHHLSHKIEGRTASTEESFQGTHEGIVNGIVEEASGVDKAYFDSLETMLHGDGHFFLCIYNPTDQGSHVFNLEQTGLFHLVELNALNHPNIRLELEGKSPLVPNAIRLDKLRKLIELWCEETVEPKEEDFEFDGKWYHPSPVAECKILGRWSSFASNNIWSLPLFEKCIKLKIEDNGTLQIGADISAYGDDSTAIAIRKGRCLLELEEHNGWSPTQTANRLKQLHDFYHKKYQLKPIEKIPIVIDDTGIGASLRDLGDNYNFIGVNFSSKSREPNLYRNKRDEINFDLADSARRGEVSFYRIPFWQQNELRTELLTPRYKLDFSGRRIVEHKDKTKELIGRSPNLADAVMLSFMQRNDDIFPITAHPPMEKRNILPSFNNKKSY